MFFFLCYIIWSGKKKKKSAYISVIMFIIMFFFLSVSVTYQSIELSRGKKEEDKPGSRGCLGPSGVQGHFEASPGSFWYNKPKILFCENVYFSKHLVLLL